MIEAVKLAELETGFMVVRDKDENLLQRDRGTLYVWSTRERAQKYIDGHNLLGECSVHDRPMTEIIEHMRDYKVTQIVVDPGEQSTFEETI